MTKIAFIGGIFTPAIQDEIISGSNGCIQYAADTLQKCYLEGLASMDCDFQLFNMPYIGSYPKFSTIFSFSSSQEILRIGNKETLCKNIHFNNLAIYKNWSRYKNLKKTIKSWCAENKTSKLVLVVYAAHTPFMKVVSEIKKDFLNVRTILIIPDLPEYMGQKKQFIMSMLGKINSRLANKLYQSFDGYIFLSEQMSEKICVKNKEYEVIEGIFSPSCTLNEDNPIDIGQFAVTYTGTLAKRYGVMNLVKAFENLKNHQAQLIIIGEGDSKEAIKLAASKDPRIKYLGQLPREKVLSIQQKSAVLVNPRTSEGEFTKYSFPSKTMEYLASGVPTIINRLPGIPKEYFNYTFQPQDESIEALRQCIEKVLNLSFEERKRVGKRAREFIMANKTPGAQCKKLIQLINRL